MDEWMDGWMDGWDWMDWMDGWMYTLFTVGQKLSSIYMNNA